MKGAEPAAFSTGTDEHGLKVRLVVGIGNILCSFRGIKIVDYIAKYVATANKNFLPSREFF